MSTAAEGVTELGIGRLFEVISDAVVIGDPSSGKITHWNPAAERLFGYSVEEAVGSEIALLAAPEARQAHRSGIERYAASGVGPIVGSGEAVEVPAVTKGGQPLWVELRVDTLTNRAGRPYVVAVIRDVSDRRALQQQLQSAADQEQQRTASLRRFASMAAHDLRGPLSTAEAFLEFAQEDDTLSIETADLLHRAHRLTRTARGRADDLLEHLLLEAGADVANPAAIPLRAAVDANHSSDGVEVEIDDDLVAIVDDRHLARILENLCSNASKYGRPPVRLRATVDGDLIHVTVTDTGPGIADEYMDRLFEPFVRGTSDPDITGSGLGLAAARTLARLNDGELRYLPGRPETTFELTLRRATDVEGNDS